MPDMREEETPPCPCCGCTKIIMTYVRKHYPAGHAAWRTCAECGLNGSEEAWNRRALTPVPAPAGEVDRLRAQVANLTGQLEDDYEWVLDTYNSIEADAMAENRRLSLPSPSTGGTNHMTKNTQEDERATIETAEKVKHVVDEWAEGKRLTSNEIWNLRHRLAAALSPPTTAGIYAGGAKADG